MKRVLSSLLAAVAVISALCAAPASAADKKVSRLGFISLAYEYLDSAIDSGLPFCNWNEESAVTDAVPLYSPDGDKIGYDLDISTDGKPAGYLRIISVNGKPRAVYSCYGGQSPAKAYSGSLENTVDGKYYFVDAMTLAVKISRGYKAVGWNSFISDESAEESYDYTMKLLKKSGDDWDDDVKAAGSARLQTVYTETENFDFCTWEDFSGIFVTDGAGNYRHPDNCSAPIAAANVLRYFRHTGASEMPYTYTDEDICMTLYFDMDTNNHSFGGFDNPGTPVENILSGIKKTCVGLAAGTPSADEKGSEAQSALSSSKIKEYIDDGYMIIATVTDRKDNGPCSLLICGYDGSSYYIVDGLSRSIDRISISNLEVYHFVAVKF